jgi:hypothetical protein
MADARKQQTVGTNQEDIKMKFTTNVFKYELILQYVTYTAKGQLPTAKS